MRSKIIFFRSYLPNLGEEENSDDQLLEEVKKMFREEEEARSQEELKKQIEEGQKKLSQRLEEQSSNKVKYFENKKFLKQNYEAEQQNLYQYYVGLIQNFEGLINKMPFSQPTLDGEIENLRRQYSVNSQYLANKYLVEDQLLDKQYLDVQQRLFQKQLEDQYEVLQKFKEQREIQTKTIEKLYSKYETSLTEKGSVSSDLESLKSILRNQNEYLGKMGELLSNQRVFQNQLKFFYRTEEQSKVFDSHEENLTSKLRIHEKLVKKAHEISQKLDTSR